MPRNVIYQTLGVSNIQNFEQKPIIKQKNKLIIPIKMKRTAIRCPQCQQKEINVKGWTERKLATPPIGSKPVVLKVEVPRVECKQCPGIKHAHLPFAEPRKQHTRHFARYVVDLRKCMTILDLARHLGVSEWMIRNIEKEYLKRHYDKPRLKDVQLIAIDEICIGKGHRYLTVVIDLQTGAVLHTGDGKGADALKPFWVRLKASHAKVKAVAIDMSPAFFSAVTENLPNAEIVFDHFHVVKLFNDKLSNLRRALFNEATEKLHKNALKGTRWLLLMNPENLNEEKNEQQRLQQALELNKPLATAYYLKEELRQLWSQPNRKQAERFLEAWCRTAESSGIRMLQKFAKTMRIHRNGLLNWYDYPISTGPLEGTNNKIKTLQRQAYGYRDMEYFQLKLFALHKSSYKLIG
ncbi:Mobile element protein [hydrothermal vent metagenome]|uniref:Mobile element protein n=1 Tax=hydrothermal vent metagenome TaxID=652676 RepID=A0A3B1E6V3_9ZZZZ